MTIENKKPTLTDYFEYVDRRIRNMREDGETSFRVRAGGQVIEMRFLNAVNAQIASRFMVGMITDSVCPPDALFYYWTEDCNNYLPITSQGNTSAVWQSRDNTGYLRITPRSGMVGVDCVRNNFYFCRQPSETTEYMLYGHAMIMQFGQWAARNGMLLLHSACIGLNGKGVMISARGGEGKSTLAVSCLLDGFEFVADDVLLVNQKGPLKGMPLYRTVGLNQDMNETLKPELTVVQSNPHRNGKLLLDASGYEFCSELPVLAILYPHISDDSKPSMRQIAPGKVLAKIIDSTATLIGVFRDPEIYRLMAQRLLGIPVFELNLCRDLERNKEFVKSFIIEEL